jgi:membrane protease YdiL (CAAX protease family)
MYKTKLSRAARGGSEVNPNNNQKDSISQKMVAEDEQYSLSKIVGIWALATAPMVLLAFVVTPAVIKWFNIPPSVPSFLVFWPFMIIGLMWQFVLSLLIVRREYGNVKWQTIRKRMCYNKPLDPRTGKYSRWLFLWVIPFIALSYASQLVPLPDVVGTIFPFVDKLPKYSLSQLMIPEYKGVWWLLVLTLITIPFNYFLGEEFLFRGILLPKMRGVFGRWDWFFNGVFFGMYHLHKPLGIPHQILFSGLILSYPAKRFRSNWMAVIIHGTEAFIAVAIIIGIILGNT